MDVEVRIISATNKNLEEMIARKKFREDLYYRLNVVPLVLPPLRNRKEDLEDLIHYFVRKFSQIMNKPVKAPDRETLKVLKHYDWPGNVRELQNVIERSVALCAEDEAIEIGNLEGGFWSQQDSEFTKIFALKDYREQSEQFKKKILEYALKQSKGNKAEAARELGMHVTHLHKLLKQFGI